jgi:hypothetical protein
VSVRPFRPVAGAIRDATPPRPRATNPAGLYRRDLGGDSKPLIWSLDTDPFAVDDYPDHHKYVRVDIARHWATRVRWRLWWVRLRAWSDTALSWLGLGVGMAWGLAVRRLRPRERRP